MIKYKYISIYEEDASMEDYRRKLDFSEELDSEFDSEFDSESEANESSPKEDFWRVLEDVDGKVMNSYNTENNEKGIRAYTAAALSRIADGIEKHNELLDKQNELLKKLVLQSKKYPS